MAIGKLYVSSQFYNWPTNNDKVFINLNNLEKISTEPSIFDCYTSIEDLENKISLAVNLANQIELVDIDTNYILNLNDEQNFNFFYFLKLAIIQNKLPYDKNLFDELHRRVTSTVNIRSNDKSIIWTVGCSFTQGWGVSPNERYGHILAKQLKMNEVCLAKGGTSISYAADQILRSDIRKNDIVVWGLTNSCRVDYCDQFEVKTCTILNYDKLKEQFWKLTYFDSLTLTVLNYRNILQVLNFCKKIGAKLYLVNLLDQGLISLLLRQYSNFIDLTKNYDSVTGKSEYIDLGSDLSHPGPKQHAEYANKIYEFIKNADRST